MNQMNREVIRLNRQVIRLNREVIRLNREVIRLNREVIRRMIQFGPRFEASLPAERLQESS